MKISEEVYIHGYIDEIRKDTVIIRNEGGYFGTIPSEIKTQEQFKAKAKEIIDNEQFGLHDKLFDYDSIDEVCVAQVDDANNAVASYPLMEFLDELYEQY